MSAAYTAAVERLSRINGVRGALVVELEAAVPVVSEMSEGVNGMAVAALAASLYRRMVQACDTIGSAGLATLQLQADDGYVVVVGAGDLIVVAVAAHDAQLGLVRVEAVRAAESIT
jgi:predicted regulator of Ras-like GTPase activity (Roadblock/LC7/MglB family)